MGFLWRYYQPMEPFIVTINGYEVKAPSAAAMAEFMREMAKQPHQDVKPSNAKHAASGPAPAPPKAPSVVIPSQTNMAASFLLTISENDDLGTTAYDLMPRLGVDHPKGIGSRLGKINVALKEAGFEPDEVYQSAKTKIGRVWTPGAKLQDALDALTLG